jgi:hypothetical protein
MRKRIWCETTPVDMVASPAVSRLLADHAVEPIVAVQPGQEADVAAAIALLRKSGLRPALWPMLDDARGRWGSAWNMDQFAAWLPTAARAVGHGRDALELFVDLEPPIGLVASVLSCRPAGNAATRAALRRGPLAMASSLLARAVQSLQADGYRVFGTAAPMLVWDRPMGRDGRVGGWQTLLGTPIYGIPWDGMHLMVYTSMLQGWSAGLLDRRALVRFVRAAAERAWQRYGPGAGISLGVTGPGALGDEPCYHRVADLIDDVGQVRAAGVQDIALFDLGGVLAREEPAGWLRALDARDGGLPARSGRFAALSIACSAVSYGVGLGARAARLCGKRRRDVALP